MHRSTCYIAFLLAVLCSGTAGAQEKAIRREVKRRRLARVDFDTLHPESLRISPDCRRVAYAVFTGRGMHMVTDRAETAEYEKLAPVVFSADSKHYAYVAERAGKQIVVFDGQPSPPYDAIMEGTPKFAPVGSRLAWVAQLGKRWLVVDQGKPGVVGDEVLAGCPVFSADGTRLAYAVRSGKAWTVVLDGKALDGSFEAIGEGSLTFSADGKRFAFWAIRNNKAVVIGDGKPVGKVYDAVVVPPRFDAAGKHLAAGVEFGGKRFVLLDGAEQPRYDNLVVDSLRFSADGNRLAYVAVRGNRYVMVVDGKPGKAHDKIGSPPVFSADGKHLAYLAVDGGKESVVLDGKPGPAFEGIIASSVRLDPTTARPVYLAGDGKAWFEVVDGKPGEKFDAVGQSGFIGDGSRRIVVAQRDGKQHVVVGGKASPGYETILVGSVSPGPAGRSTAWVIRKDNQFHVVIDGHEGDPWDRVFSVVTWNSPFALHYIAARGRSLYLVEERIVFE